MRISGSYRDPSGHVYEKDGRILRTVSPEAAASYEAVRDSGLIGELAGRGWLVPAAEVDRMLLPEAPEPVSYLVEHPRLPHVSYPYEWSFLGLKQAALLHLDLHLVLLERGFTLSDATAYNIQFQGPQPVFIDLLSIRPYRDGEYWTAHRQFCEQFLNPLLLRALLGVPANGWYRGNLDGVPTADLARLVRWRHRLSWNVLAHVIFQDRLQRQSLSSDTAATREKLSRRPLPLSGYRAMLRQLRNWISRLTPADTGRTAWSDYATGHGYADGEEQAKRRMVCDFVEKTRPDTLWDLGCNTGDYAALSLDAGARRVIGFDFDHTVLDTAYRRAIHQNLDFLPLFMDAANPSPSQGWNQSERAGLSERAGADALIALAFGHHLAIGRNVPLDQLCGWICGLAPRGLIEFVDKNDPQVQRMLALREDVFLGYDNAAFEAALSSNAGIVKVTEVSSHGRKVYWYDRTAG
ncbi:MAG: class I SAM-dependent methyltransferase [Planctomycetes bacterium]|nr:class I SAM-dependent methyltransferase [Planctomycetota bacterium]